MKKTIVKLQDIPDAIIPVIRTTDNNSIWYEGKPVKYIHKHENTYRIYCTGGHFGEYRTEDGSIEIGRAHV